MDSDEGWALFSQLLDIDSADVLARFLANHPAIFTDEMRAHLDELAGLEGWQAVVAEYRLLLDTAVVDSQRAWTEHQDRSAQRAPAERALARNMERFHQLMGARSWRLAGELGLSLLPSARELGQPITVAILHDGIGRALMQSTGPERYRDLDEAIEHLGHAARGAPLAEYSADSLMHMALAMSDRILGDPAENLRNAVEALRDAAALIQEHEHPRLYATIHTNLAQALIRAPGDRRHNLLEAIDSCHHALRHRSPDLDADDWAYTQLNLAQASNSLLETEDGDRAAGRGLYHEILGESDAIHERRLVARAHEALARLLLGESRDPEADPTVGTDLMAEARQHFELALRDVDSTSDVLMYGRVLEGLNDALGAQGEEEHAIEIGRVALRILRPSAAPYECRKLGFRLGVQLSNAGAWDEAATVFLDAIEAADHLYYSRLDTTSREDEARLEGNLYRWAPFALLRSGSVDVAALVLEAGRGRELRRRIGLTEHEREILAHADSELHDQYLKAAGRLGQSPLRGDGSQVSREFELLMAQVRTIPGLEVDRLGAGLHDLSRAVAPDCPLVYIDPTPWGTITVIVRTQAGSDELVIDTVVSEVTSEEILAMLVAGVEELPAGEVPDDLVSFVAAAAGHADRAELALALERLLPWIGRSICQPIADALDAATAVARLVVCGPLELAPLHAAPVTAGTRTLPFGELVHVKLGPSAATHAESGRRSNDAGPPSSLVAIADPQWTLPAAQAEVRAIQRMDLETSTDAAFDVDATAGWFLERAPSADILHLACHARGLAYDADAAEVFLHDTSISAAQLPTLARLSAKLVVLASCQSGISVITDLGNEPFSLSTAFVAAGAAAVIASLWEVDDFGTSLLMLKLYENLQATGFADPAASLTEARLWLRELDRTGEEAFVARHPDLDREFQARIARGDPPGASEVQGARDRPYSRPEYWAPFVLVGG